jgi:phenylacetate-CoA ligase
MNWRKPLIYGLLRATGSQIPGCLTRIRQVEFLNKKDLYALQDKKLKRLLRHAYDKVPYYRDVLADHRVVVDEKIRLDNFSSLPLLTKKIVREQGDRLHASDASHRKCHSNTSGGSTGEPLHLLQDKQYFAWNTATVLYFNGALGKDLGESEIKFWGSDRDILAGSLAFKDRVINQLYHREFFNTYRLGSNELDQLIALNNRFKPVAYWSYMESALELARYLAKHPQTFVPPKFVISTIGPLTDDVRREIQTYMKCPVYNQYGSREVGGMSCECPSQQGMHTFPWWNRVEVVDDQDQPMDHGEGRVVVTTLENYTMPLIRYDIGDVAIADGYGCECGRHSFKLKTVMGRTLGYFKKPDGSLAHSHFLVQALFFRDWIKRFQVVQDRLDHILIRIEKVASSEVPAADLTDIIGKVKVLMGDACEVECVFVPEIERSASGKYVYTRCEI